MNSAKGRTGALALAMALTLAAGAVLPAARAHAADSDVPRARGRGGFLGVRMQELTDDLRDSYSYRGAGVLVAGVSEGSPAEKAGIQEGDIITKLDDLPVNGPDQLAERVSSRGPGSMVSLWVWRDGKEISLGRVELGSQGDERGEDSVGRRPSMHRAPRPPHPPAAPPPPDAPRVDMRDHDGDDEHGDDDDHDLEGLQGLEGLRGLEGMGDGNGPMVMSLGRGRLGVELSDLDSDLGSYFRGDGGRGVLVTRVLEGTPADKAGLKAGDVITEFDGRSVGSSDDLRRLVNDHAAGEVSVRVRRHGEERSFSARLGESPRMSFRSLPGGKGWMGWMDGHGNGDGADKDKVERRVYRYKGPGGGDMWRGNGDQRLSPEDRAQLRKDMDQLRKDLRQMRLEMHQKMQKGDDDSRDEGKDNDRDDDDDDSGDN